MTSLLTSGIAKLVLGSFDRNIFWHQNRQVNDHKYFFLYIFQNHRGITVSLDALCFEKSNQIKSNMTLIVVDKPQPSYNLLDVMK